MNANAKPKLRLSNNKALFLWGFAAIFIWFTVTMVYLVIRDGPPSDSPPLFVEAVLLVFCLAGLGLSSWAGKQPCYRLDVLQNGRVRTVIRYPLITLENQWLRQQFSPAVVVETVDSDGDPYFYGRLTLPDGTLFHLIEGHDRETCELACQNLNRYLESATFAGNAQN